MRSDDADAMWADMHDADGNRFTGTHDTFTFDQIRAWTASRAEQDDRLDLAVVDPETDEWLGEVVILDWDEPNRSCGFRIALSPSARDRGIGTEATRLIVDYVFEHLPINRISLEVYDFNARGIAVYEKVGFMPEGRLREALLWDGEFHDAIGMSMLRSDWEARRGD